MQEKRFRPRSRAIRTLHLAAAALLALAAPLDEARAQVRSNVAGISLIAYKASGVSIPQRAEGAVVATDEMFVSTPYRVEIRRVGGEPLVVHIESRAGRVPWDLIRARIRGRESPVFQLVVLPPL